MITHPYSHSQDDQKVNHNNRDICRIVERAVACAISCLTSDVGKPKIIPRHFCKWVGGGRAEDRGAAGVGPLRLNHQHLTYLYTLLFLCARDRRRAGQMCMSCINNLLADGQTSYEH